MSPKFGVASGHAAGGADLPDTEEYIDDLLSFSSLSLGSFIL